MKTFPPRLHVLLAREAPLGVVIRRGPSKRVATFLWDRRHDEFSLGQWLKGRIYERRSDLSSDGKHLIYFAMNGKWRSETLGSWTAISRAPYLKALVLFAQGDCWGGGGLWTGKSSYWLNSGYTKILQNSQDVVRDTGFEPTNAVGNECLGVYFPRLIRDGWELVDRSVVENRQFIFQKPTRFGWTLRKIVNAGRSQEGKGCYWDEHELIPTPASKSKRADTELSTIACHDWEWAEVDGSRIVWAARGKLFAAEAGKHGLIGEIELQDFNNMPFKAVEAPY